MIANPIWIDIEFRSRGAIAEQDGVEFEDQLVTIESNPLLSMRVCHWRSGFVKTGTR